ncbi:MAG: leucine-rich repeat protein [Bacilli bacterium]|nr:leucine-rich repeat protein [Bacilli bacterium]
MKEDFEYIKKFYGEHIAKLCREIVPELFEEPTLVPRLMAACFAPHHELYKDLMILGKYNLRNLMYTRLNRKEELFTSPKSAKELLQDAGYNLFVCTKPEDINYFKHCYDPDELLCTFRDGVESRFEESYYFFLTTENAFRLKREDFPNPDRNDDYSKSIICLQVNRNSHTVRMTSRYNHGVDFPDSMFSNNLDNINPGLRYAFERDFGIKVSQQDCVSLGDLQELHYVEYGPYSTFYKFNEIIDDKIYCPNNVVLEDGEVHYVDRDSKNLLDYYVIDHKEKVFRTYDKEQEDHYQDTKFKKCDYVKGKDIDTYKITFEDDHELYLMADRMNRIVSVLDNSSTEIGDNYFSFCPYIRDVTLGRVRKIGNNFVSGSKELTNLYTPYAEVIGDNYAYSNTKVRDFTMDYLCYVGANCFQSNKGVRDLYLPSMIVAGGYFFGQNEKMRSINLPNCTHLGTESFGWCENVQELSIPNLVDAGSDCFFTDYYAKEYVEETVMKNFERGDSNELDMVEVSNYGFAR